jgi:stress response protein YsnF
MLTDRELSDAVGTTAYGADGEPLGAVRHFLADDRTGTPTWAAVRPDPSGPRLVVVPVTDARFADGGLRVPVRRELVDGAPLITTADHLDPEEERLLRRYYGMEGNRVADPGEHTGAGQVRDVGLAREVDGPAAEPPTVPDVPVTPADAAMTRSEEQLRVRREQVAATRLRLVKYVVTEEVQVTVPLRREEVRLEEVPLDAPDPGPGESLAADGGYAAAGQRTGLPDEIVLHREEPVIGVRVVPAERVRLRTDVVEGRAQVSGQVQREQIVVDES